MSMCNTKEDDREIILTDERRKDVSMRYLPSKCFFNKTGFCVHVFCMLGTLGSVWVGNLWSLCIDSAFHSGRKWCSSTNTIYFKAEWNDILNSGLPVSSLTTRADNKHKRTIYEFDAQATKIIKLYLLFQNAKVNVNCQNRALPVIKQ
jgi:hypothetical protein